MNIKSIKKIKTKERIFDINVRDNHNFGANNILVHNCIESYSVTKTSEDWKMESVNGIVQTTETDSMYHSCNLISVNVGIIFNDKLLRRVCANAVRMLDASIETGTMPVLEAEKSSNFLRNIGIGVVGLADWIAYKKLSYDTEEGLLEIEKLQEKIAWYCYEASVSLSKEKGSYPGFNPDNYTQLFGKTPKELDRCSPNGFNWSGMIDLIKSEGIRNFLLLAIAPNSSSGIVMNSSASWLPVHSKFGYQTLADINTPIIPRYLNKRYWYYRGKFDYPAEVLLKASRVIQRWVDTGISTEVDINPKLTSIKKISDEILDGFDKKELKGVYYCITVDGEHDGCVACAN